MNDFFNFAKIIDFRIHNIENYNAVEKIFRKSVEFCNDHDVWKLNVAHVLFMQENAQNQSPHKFKEAAGFYEPIVKRNYDAILNVEAVVLANLCVGLTQTVDILDNSIFSRQFCLDFLDIFEKRGNFLDILV